MEFVITALTLFCLVIEALEKARKVLAFLSKLRARHRPGKTRKDRSN